MASTPPAETPPPSQPVAPAAPPAEFPAPGRDIDNPSPGRFPGDPGTAQPPEI